MAEDIVTALMSFETLMARLYRVMARTFPQREKDFLQLAAEETRHASMLAHVRDTFLPLNIIKPEDITLTLTQLKQHTAQITQLATMVETQKISEREAINAIIDLELAGTELQINRIVADHKDSPAFKVFWELIQADEAHNRLLQQW
jgi:hypothetical protein